MDITMHHTEQGIFIERKGRRILLHVDDFDNFLISFPDGASVTGEDSEIRFKTDEGDEIYSYGRMFHLLPHPHEE